jgi:hypothetical protein
MVHKDTVAIRGTSSESLRDNARNEPILVVEVYHGAIIKPAMPTQLASTSYINSCNLCILNLGLLELDDADLDQQILQINKCNPARGQVSASTALVARGFCVSRCDLGIQVTTCNMLNKEEEKAFGNWDFLCLRLTSWHLSYK